MLWIIALAIVVIVALAIISFALHFLLSPWLIVPAIAFVLWLKFRPRHSHR
jgi:hypothetical protein